jgi:hypothetical protein
VAASEAPGQIVLIDAAMPGEDFHDAQSHGSVVGPGPFRRRQLPPGDQLLSVTGRAEEALSECVANGESSQGDECAPDSDIVIGRQHM